MSQNIVILQKIFFALYHINVNAPIPVIEFFYFPF